MNISLSISLVDGGGEKYLDKCFIFPERHICCGYSLELT